MRAARLLAVVALVVLPLVPAAPAGAAAPVATGWWSFAAQPGRPAPPPPPDVREGDLLVQAGDPTGLTLGSTDAAPAPSAVAALRFDVPAGATVGPLVLPVADGAAAMDVRAYATTPDWKPATGAPLAEAPVPDRARYSLGVLDGTTLVFRDIGRLLPETGPLSVVLLPGVADRVVLRKPGATALAVTASQSVAAPAPSAAASPATALEPGLQAPSVPDVAPGPEGAPLDPAVAAPAVEPDGALPPPAAVAPAPADQVAVAPVALPARLPAPFDDTRTRYLAAAEAALVLLTFALLRGGALAPWAGTAPEEPAGPRERGVGRFVRERSGRPVRL